MDNPKPRNWWQRNWKWVVPVGCLTPILVCGGGVTLILMLAFGMIKSSDVYKESLAKAQAEPRVVAALGEPLQPGFLVSGNISLNGASGSADLSIPISGPKGAGHLYVTATKNAGTWTYSTLQVAPENSKERIDLLTAGK